MTSKDGFAGSLFRHADPFPLGTESGFAMTVLGPLAVEKLGVTLMHEHILLDASGKWVPPCCCSERHIAEMPVKIENLGELQLNPLMSRDNCQLFDSDLAVEELMKFRALGGETVVDPTNIGIGRDPKALQRISRLTGLNIIMGTGFYLEPSHPDYVKSRSLEALTDQIIYDVGGFSDKPEVVAGLIGEIGVSAAFTANEEKSLRAAGRASAKTGVPMQIHLPGWERYGHKVLDILAEEGTNLRHVVLCHMNPSFADKNYQRTLAERGAFLEYDMIGMPYFYADESAQSPSDEDNARAIRELIDDGFIEQVLLSQDVFLKTMLTKFGGHGYGYILKHFVPRLRRHGVTGEQLETLLIGNPQRVLVAKYYLTERPMDQDVIALTRALLGFNTINPPGDEVECLSWLASFLSDTGFEVKLHYFGERRCNLIATLAGSAAGKPLAFTGHLDTVPLGNAQWKFDPFAGEIADGKLYGRGSSDMKAAIAAFIVACIHRQEVIAQNSGVMLILTGGEETGCDGARAMINDPNLTLAQPGALIVGEPTDNYPMVGHKGALWLRCATHGKTAHGAMPELGINAIYLAADAIGKIRHFEPGPPHPLMKKPTLNVGTFQGGLNINSVPDKASFDVDMRTDPTLTHATLKSRLQQHLSDVVTINTLVDLPAVLTERQNPWVQRVFAHCQPLHDQPVEAKIVPYFTDAALLVDALGNPPCLILGPGEPSMAHQTDEYCRVSRLEESVGLYQQIIEDYYLLIEQGAL